MKAKVIRWPANIPKLSSPRLRLRGLILEDTDDYFELNRNPAVMRSYGILPHKTKAETKKLIRNLDRGFRKHEWIRWGIEEKTTGKIIGDVGFWRFVPVRARAELGAKLLPAYWSGGIMTEAMATLFDYAFSKLNLQSIEGNAEVENAASQRMLDKLGFTRLEITPQHSYSINTESYVDTVLYNLLGSDWMKKRESRYEN